ncbi:DUF1949 domain-containing protein [candidate division GN15 bacterium]|nr:DUF1949 domain-containing protein [candidate division GN15 bacterium]
MVPYRWSGWSESRISSTRWCEPQGMDDSYLTIKQPARHEIKVKGSRFIGESFIAASPENAVALLEEVRKREHAATHHCFAWQAGLFDERQFKYSDDGEPSGTAGKPIYDVICGRELDYVLLVVTRYFGGTKLGTGGLVRAYSETAQKVLDDSGWKRHYVMALFQVTIDFSLYDPLMKLLHQHQATQDDAQFTDRVRVVLAIRQSRAAEFEQAIVELSKGQAEIEAIGTTQR